MNYDYNTYLNTNNFLLSLVIVATIILCYVVGILFWLKNIKKSVKIALAYLLAVTVIYELSTLFTFYSPPRLLLFAAYVKVAAAFLIKSAFLFFVAVYMENTVLIWAFFAVQILSFATFIPAVLLQSYRDSIITFSAPCTVRYGEGAQLYAVISSAFYIISGFIFYFSSRLFKQKRIYLAFLVLFTVLNLVILAFAVFGTKDALHEKMHIFILAVLLATLLKMSPFYDKKDALLSTVNIINNVDEALIILDRHGRAGHIDNYLKGINILDYTEEIVRNIDKHGDLPGIRENKLYPEKNTILEGDFDLEADKTVHIHYSITPLLYRNSYIGSICVLRDVTAYKELLYELLEKNNLLHEAFEAQKEHMRVTRSLTGEEERSRILEIVNIIAGDYLNDLKQQVLLLEPDGNDEALFAQRVEKENSHMIVMTRDTIEKIRSTVRQLYNKQGGGEAV